jgi:hypothetical protein
MFEALSARAARTAERRARELAERIADEVPEAAIEASADGVRVSGPGARLRWTMMGLMR